jgi:hypothetical protein
MLHLPFYVQGHLNQAVFLTDPFPPVSYIKHEHNAVSHSIETSICSVVITL